MYKLIIQGSLSYITVPKYCHVGASLTNMNDFSRASQLLFSILFADDTSVFLIGKEYTQLIISLNEELKKVSRWLNAKAMD